MCKYSYNEYYELVHSYVWSKSTQPGHSFMGRRNEYQPKASDALWLGSKGRYGSCVGGR